MLKQYYKFGEIILALREEYSECKHLLDELNKQINVGPEVTNYYFSGLLKQSNPGNNHENARIRLYVQKRYIDVLKKIQHIRHDWYAQYLYSAIFNVEKESDDLYGLKYDDIFTPVDGRKYIPEVQINNKEEFSKLINELFSTDLMQLTDSYFTINSDHISLNFDEAFISTQLGTESFVHWDGIADTFKYSVKRDNSPSLLEDIFELEIPTNKLSPDWLKILEKHEYIFNKELLFSVDENVQSKKGVLQISDIDRSGDSNFVRFLKK